MQTKSPPWFRLYSEVLSDRKIQRICHTTQQPKALVIGVWTVILSLASESPERGKLIISEGLPVTFDEICFETGLDSNTCKIIIEAFIATSMLQVEGDTYEVTQWNARQFASDNVNERVARYRERKKQAGNDTGKKGNTIIDDYAQRYGNVTSNETVTPPESESDKDSYTKPDDEIDKDLTLKQQMVISLYHNNIRATESPLTLEEMVKPEYLNLPVLWWRQAVKIATDNGVYKWCYVRGVLEKSREANIEPDKVPKEVWAGGTYQHAPKKSAKQGEGAFTFPPLPASPPPPSPLPLHAQIWQQAQAILQPYAVALAGVEAQPSANGKFTLTAPKDKKEWIDGRLNDKILQALRQFKPDIQQLEVLTR